MEQREREFKWSVAKNYWTKLHNQEKLECSGCWLSITRRSSEVGRVDAAFFLCVIFYPWEKKKCGRGKSKAKKKKKITTNFLCCCCLLVCLRKEKNIGRLISPLPPLYLKISRKQQQQKQQIREKAREWVELIFLKINHFQGKPEKPKICESCRLIIMAVDGC